MPSPSRSIDPNDTTFDLNGNASQLRSCPLSVESDQLYFTGFTVGNTYRRELVVWNFSTHDVHVRVADPYHKEQKQAKQLARHLEEQERLSAAAAGEPVRTSAQPTAAVTKKLATKPKSVSRSARSRLRLANNNRSGFYVYTLDNTLLQPRDKKHIAIEFRPTEYRYYHDFIDIACGYEYHQLRVWFHAHPMIDLDLPLVCDLGRLAIAETRSKTITVVNPHDTTYTLHITAPQLPKHLQLTLCTTTSSPNEQGTCPVIDSNGSENDQTAAPADAQTVKLHCSLRPRGQATLSLTICPRAYVTTCYPLTFNVDWKGVFHSKQPSVVTVHGTCKPAEDVVRIEADTQTKIEAAEVLEKNRRKKAVETSANKRKIRNLGKKASAKKHEEPENSKNKTHPAGGGPGGDAGGANDKISSYSSAALRRLHSMLRATERCAHGIKPTTNDQARKILRERRLAWRRYERLKPTFLDPTTTNVNQFVKPRAIVCRTLKYVNGYGVTDERQKIYEVAQDYDEKLLARATFDMRQNNQWYERHVRKKRFKSFFYKLIINLRARKRLPYVKRLAERVRRNSDALDNVGGGEADAAAVTPTVRTFATNDDDDTSLDESIYANLDVLKSRDADEERLIEAKTRDLVGDLSPERIVPVERTLNLNIFCRPQSAEMLVPIHGLVYMKQKPNYFSRKKQQQEAKAAAAATAEAAKAVSPPAAQQQTSKGAGKENPAEAAKVGGKKQPLKSAPTADAPKAGKVADENDFELTPFQMAAKAVESILLATLPTASLLHVQPQALLSSSSDARGAEAAKPLLNFQYLEYEKIDVYEVLRSTLAPRQSLTLLSGAEDELITMGDLVQAPRTMLDPNGYLKQFRAQFNERKQRNNNDVLSRTSEDGEGGHVVAAVVQQPSATQQQFCIGAPPLSFLYPSPVHIHERMPSLYSTHFDRYGSYFNLLKPRDHDTLHYQVDPVLLSNKVLSWKQQMPALGQLALYEQRALYRSLPAYRPFPVALPHYSVGQLPPLLSYDIEVQQQRQQQRNRQLAANSDAGAAAATSTTSATATATQSNAQQSCTVEITDELVRSIIPMPKLSRPPPPRGFSDHFREYAHLLKHKLYDTMGRPVERKLREDDVDEFGNVKPTTPKDEDLKEDENENDAFFNGLAVRDFTMGAQK